MNCKRCKHWRKAEPRKHDPDPIHGDCQRVPHRWDGFHVSPREAIVEDASGYYAALKTGPDFGCSLGEAVPHVTCDP